MAYASWSVVFGEQPSAAKWNILGSNDSHFNARIGSASAPVQQIVNTTSTAVSTTTTTVPNDDTIPQNTEGAEFMTLAITPKSTTNILVIEIIAMLSTNAANSFIGALFQDTTANALAAGQGRDPAGATPTMFVLRHAMAAGTTSSTTFKFRAGPVSAGTLTFNGSAGARQFGAITKSSIVITEYLSPSV